MLDPAPFLISSPGFTQQENPQIAFNGTNFFVVWNDRTAGPDIRGGRVTPAGVALDPSGIAISTAADSQLEPHVAANRTNGDYFVVWRDNRRRGESAAAADVFGARVSNDGVVRDPTRMSITNTDKYEQATAVAPTICTDVWDVAYARFAAGPQYGSYRVFHRTVIFD